MFENLNGGITVVSTVVCVFEQTLQDNQRLTYAKDLMLCTDSIDAAQTQKFVGGIDL